METALIVMFIILAIESFALQFLYVKFYIEKKKLNQRLSETIKMLGRRSNFIIKQKIEEALATRGKFDELEKEYELKVLKEQSILYERLVTELNTKVKCLEAYFDLVYKTETDGHIFRSYYEKEPNENNSGGYTNKFYIVNKDDVKLTEEPFEKTSFKVKGVKKSDELKSVAASVAVKKGIEVLSNVLSQFEEG